MDLNTLWFVLIAVLFIGYFVLDGFDLGVGILLPFLGKDDKERRMIINAIGPHWDGNEVWLITAGGAMFAAFPLWYATLFSGFYLAFFLLLIGLIFRGIGLEFRSKDENPVWRRFWDWAICVGSFIPALLWGVALANFVRGVPINAMKYYVGNFGDLLNPYALLGGLVSLLGFTLHGALFLALKTGEPILSRACQTARRLWWPTAVVLLAFTIATYVFTDIYQRLGVNPGPVPIGAVLSLMAAGWFIHQKHEGWGFTMTTLTIILSASTIFLTLYPRVLVSSLDPNFSLTIYNSASGINTLRTMTIVALILVPFVLVYQGWSYWVFRRRITGRQEELHY
ncbi:cytochrome d ubiquinol oxidase subunit 2 [Thermanaerothrix daxensis]|uniref:Cytochrome d ubiquinol oxidase subunit 2 n=1 Tax=Thermanaerothrix daxensis TaxID=869279 RepID=A0A0P6Y4Y0_9CHLR|nr:cytochrome d ubiquinol oxidase subunit II [Thermanaerothrix daxensis]KPL84425.1 cytochrome d ubiquinol oxidase subunit 2 [Thermanaerothrix daxensis]